MPEKKKLQLHQKYVCFEKNVKFEICSHEHHRENTYRLEIW